MDTLAALAQGFAVAITPAHLMWAAIGVTLGTAIGVLPGIGPSTTVALLLPVTFGLEPASAFIMFGGIYYGAQYGGSTASILLNTPGEAGAVMTAIEGNAMARTGRAGPALATAAIGSFIAGTVGTIGLTFVAPWLAEIALKLGPAEYATLMVLALTTVSALFGTSVSRGLLSLVPRPSARHRRARPAAGPPALCLRRAWSWSTASTRSSSPSACSRSARPCMSRRVSASSRESHLGG